MPTPNAPAPKPPPSLTAYLGLARSIAIYYGNPFKLRQMAHFYQAFICPGDLCFDVGAHVGNRLRVWSKLGARCVGVEPQPLCMALLRRWYGRNPAIELVEQAVGATAGAQTLHISESNPTVTTLSGQWIAQVQQEESFAAVHWDTAATVEVTTLDALIARFGKPAFCKIDIEGYEAEALAGLSQPLPALSFEFLPASKDVALACIERLEQLGRYQYNWSLGERHQWERPQWVTAPVVRAFLAGLQAGEMSGDVYARVSG
jgi:FkbM family methyltransferase